MKENTEGHWYGDWKVYHNKRELRRKHKALLRELATWISEQLLSSGKVLHKKPRGRARDYKSRHGWIALKVFVLNSVGLKK